MTPEEQEYDNLLQEVSNGNGEAYAYLVTMSKVFRVWDDLWDQDAEAKKETIDEVFGALSFELSRNSFYMENRAALESFIFLAWNAWKDSEIWKGNPDKIKGTCAWFIRDFCNEIDVLVAWLVGGKNHARKISIKCRGYYLKRLQSRGMDGFVKE